MPVKATTMVTVMVMLTAKELSPTVSLMARMIKTKTEANHDDCSIHTHDEDEESAVMLMFRYV